MSINNVKEYFKKFNIEDRIIILENNTATISSASIALNIESDKIAKTLSFLVNDEPILIVVSGDSRIDNNKYKQYFHKKCKMINFELVNDLIGHNVGGVCPFGIKDNVKTYLDISLKEHEFIYPACGNDFSAIKLSCDELEKYSQNFISWIDVTKKI